MSTNRSVALHGMLESGVLRRSFFRLAALGAMGLVLVAGLSLTFATPL